MGVIIAFILARLALRSRLRIAPHESEAVFHSCRYYGPTVGRFAAVAHARSATRCYYAARWIAELFPDCGRGGGGVSALPQLGPRNLSDCNYDWVSLFRARQALRAWRTPRSPL